jgi:16S rRNA (cytosine967-C5)-methyltransferase
MTPAARLQAVIEILALGGSEPLDRQLKGWFRAHRFAGAKDRRAITGRVYDIFRHRAHFAHRMASDAPRALVIASLLVEGDDPEILFSGGYGPPPLTDSERVAIAHPPDDRPAWVEGEYPAWMEGELARAFGNLRLEELQAFQKRAPVDLRVNRLKATREEVASSLRADSIACAPLEDLPDALRCDPGSALTDHPLYRAGAFEIQDASAQRSVTLCKARPGMRVLDLAAGAGGKSLALAAAMENRGEIIACDIRGAALKELERRAARAGASIIRTHLLGAPPQGPFDLVLLDAPCSGSGTWRRQPELKWRLTPERLAQLRQTQDRLLEQAARARGTRLVYVTCSILPSENEDRIEALFAKGSGYRRAGADFHATPLKDGGDGFYAAILERSPLHGAPDSQRP